MTEIDLDSEQLDKPTALALAGRICARATQQAVASCHLLELIGDFDARGGLGYLHGVKSVAHWISYSCSMSPGVAREHVRVARALRRMPTITAAFRSGELSYSKVREVTRVVDLVDEARLCSLARAASASQLARIIAGYRIASGTRISQQELRRFRLINSTADGMTKLAGQLPADESAIVAAALQRARDLNSTPPPKDVTGDATPTYADAEALRDICQHYLNTAVTDDESGEDRSLVIIQVAAEQLLDTGAGYVPAGTSQVDPPLPITSLMQPRWSRRSELHTFPRERHWSSRHTPTHLPVQCRRTSRPEPRPLPWERHRSSRSLPFKFRLHRRQVT